MLLASSAAALDKLPEHDPGEREVFTVAEVSRLVEAAGAAAWQDSVFPATMADSEGRAARCEDWQGMILLGFYARARLGDCGRLTWGAIDLNRGTLSFMPAKTERKRKRLEVPLHPRLRQSKRESLTHPLEKSAIVPHPSHPHNRPCRPARILLECRQKFAPACDRLPKSTENV